MDDLELKIFPNGTVVRLKDAEKKLMIIGYGQMDVKTNKIYDFSAVLFPEGYFSASKVFVFNAEDVEEVYHVGYIDDDGYDFIAQQNEALLQMRGE